MAESTTEGFSPERSRYYTHKMGEFLSRYPIDFTRFVENRKVIDFGDKLLFWSKSGGYNFASYDQYPLNSKDSLIFYGVYAQRARHFGKLLSKLEERDIIGEEDVTFGLMATKILGDYKDKEPVVRTMRLSSGKLERTMESVEALAIFHPGSEEQAKSIGVFLVEEAPKIPGAYIDPNIRTTVTTMLVNALVKEGFKMAKANVYEYASGNIIALKQKTSFGKDEGWRTIETPIHPQLYEYLVSFGVEP